MEAGGVFLDSLERFGDETALILECGRIVSYAALAASASALANCIDARQLVFVLAQNSEESLLGYIGAMRRRAPVALLSSGMNPDLLAGLIAAYHPRYIWAPADRAAIASGATVRFSYGQYSLFDCGEYPVDIHPDLALLMTTSGSTGSPKFVRQSYRNIAANTASICEYLDIKLSDRALTSLPMNYVFGLSVINTHLASGAALVLTDRGLMEKGFWALAKQHGVTTFSGVPYTYQMLKQLRFARMNLPALRTLTQAGGKLPADLAREFSVICAEKSIRFVIMYGAAEATARMSYLPAEYSLEKADSIGIAIPGGTFSLVDEHGNAIDAVDTPGELVYHGDNVALGYASSCKDLARGDDRGGVLETGDIAKRDADGFYYIVGRKSRFIKIFGNRVSLEDLEHQLRKRGIDCACAGRDDKLLVFVTSSQDQQAGTRAVQEITGLHHSAFSVTMIAEIPRNDIGKIIYSDLPKGE